MLQQSTSRLTFSARLLAAFHQGKNRRRRGSAIEPGHEVELRRLERLEDRTLLTPDLLPFDGFGGFDDALVIRTSSQPTGTTANFIAPGRSINVDIPILNGGFSDTGKEFSVELQVDKQVPIVISKLGPLAPNFGVILSRNIGTLPSGVHTVTVTIDSLDEIAESNEINNVITREFVVQNWDFGDAPTAEQTLFPNSYPTTFSNNGAYHTAVNGLSIGTDVDPDINGRPHISAQLDDSTGLTSNDEDGVRFLGALTPGGTSSFEIDIVNTVGPPQLRLDAWLDFNRDGNWSFSERIYGGAVTTGTNTINFPVPIGASPGNSYARFRLSIGGGLQPTGDGGIGEVEDHAVNILPLPGRWQFEGPAPTQDGQVENVFPNNQITGAIHTVLAHPTNPNILYIGAVNGGIWKTTNATSTNPTWVPQTDFLESLSIGAMAFDYSDPTFNTIVAGTSSYSSFAGVSGTDGRVYRTTNGGLTWTQVPGAGLSTSEEISGIAARGSTIVVTSAVNGGGIFRSTDTGNTFSVVEDADFFDNDNFSDLVVDLSDATGQRLYAAGEQIGATGGGIYRSDDFGITWAKITGMATNAQMDLLLDQANNIEMAVHPGTGRLYVAVLVGSQPQGIFYSQDPTAMAPSWTQMDIPVLPLGAAQPIADASNTTPVVITAPGHGLGNGDFVVVTGVGGNTAANGTFAVRVISADRFELENSAGNGAYTTGGSFTPVTSPNPSRKDVDETGSQGRIHFSIAVHPENEDIIFVGGDRQEIPNVIGDNSFGGAIFRGNAGIGRNPQLVPSPQWDHITNDRTDFDPEGGTANGSGTHADSREMVFDANGDLIETDDGGIFRRTSPRDNAGDWFSLAGNLGVIEFHDVAYDTISNRIIGGAQDNGTQMQNARGGTVWEFFSGGDGGDVAVDNLTRAAFDQSVRYSSSQNLGGFRRSIFDEFGQLVSSSSVGLNLIGGGTPVSSDVQFVTPVILNTIDPSRMIIGGSSNLWESFNQGNDVFNISSGIGINSQISTAAPAVYGGSRLGVANEDLLYVGSGSNVYVRTSGTVAPSISASYPGGFVRDIIVDPDDWMRAYVIDSNQVFFTNDAGASWTDVTGDLMSLAGSSIRAIEYVPGAFDRIVVGGALGVFEVAVDMAIDNTTMWTEIGTNLPNAVVSELVYDAADDLLIVGTFGRGVWSYPNAGLTLAGEPTLSVSISPDAINEGDTTTVTITRNTDTTTDLFVTITNGDPTEAAILGSVLIPAGKDTVMLSLDGVQDFLVDGDQLVTITASSAGFVSGSDDVTVRDIDVATLSISIDLASISENGGTSQATVFRNTIPTGDLIVTLMSDDTSEASVPMTVTIPDGMASASFTITGVDDPIVDGTQTATITATSNSFLDGTDTIDVTDDDVPTLTLTIDLASLSEPGGTAMGTVSRNTDTSADLMVTLASDDTSEATVPMSVTIPMGKTSAMFPISAQDDDLDDGTQTVTISASAGAFVSASQKIDVNDDDTAGLIVLESGGSTQVAEGGTTDTYTVALATEPTDNVQVQIMPDSQTSVGAGPGLPVTLFFNAGSWNKAQTITVTAFDDVVAEGNHKSVISHKVMSADPIYNALPPVNVVADVLDNDTATLMLTINAASLSENAGKATATVSRNSETTNALQVNIVNSDPGELFTAKTVVIPAGMKSLTFDLLGVDDPFADGTQTVTLTAKSSGFVSDQDTIDVADDDSTGDRDDILFFDGTTRQFKLGTNTKSGFTWFQTGALPGSAANYDVFIDDFNSDGELDGAVRNRSTKVVNTFLNNGDGTLSGPFNRGTAGTAGTTGFLQVGDYDGNGQQELLWLYTDGPYSGAVFTKDLLTGQTFFMVTANPNYNEFVTGDFNGDGFDDLVGLFDSADKTKTNIIPFYSIASNNPSLPRRLRPLSSGVVQGTIAMSFAVDGLAQVRAIDLNADGRDDLVAMATSGSQSGQIAHATTTGDLSGDGMIFADIHRFVASFRAPNLSPAIYPGPLLLGRFDDNLFQDVDAISNSGMVAHAGTQVDPGLLNPVIMASPPLNFGQVMAGLTYVVGDFNGDGYDDLAGLGVNAYVFLSTGSGNSFDNGLDFGAVIGGTGQVRVADAG
ncbi:MAG: hypothetical protein KDA80_02160 [Planctomycetaceae bacterium]|nr:hypothetical protein [Planctomycetaceae bacterium]